MSRIHNIVTPLLRQLIWIISLEYINVPKKFRFWVDNMPYLAFCYLRQYQYSLWETNLDSLSYVVTLRPKGRHPLSLYLFRICTATSINLWISKLCLFNKFLTLYSFAMSLLQNVMVNIFIIKTFYRNKTITYGVNAVFKYNLTTLISTT